MSIIVGFCLLVLGCGIAIDAGTRRERTAFAVLLVAAGLTLMIVGAEGRQNGRINELRQEFDAHALECRGAREEASRG